MGEAVRRQGADEVFLRFQWHITAVARRILRDDQMVSDAIHDVYLHLVRVIGSYSGRGPLRAWVGAVAANVCRHIRRGLGRERPSDEAAKAARSLDTPEREALRAERASVCRVLAESLVGTLSGRQRAVVEMRFYGGMSHERIAYVMGVSCGAVRSALSRALASMRRSRRAGRRLAAVS